MQVKKAVKITGLSVLVFAVLLFGLHLFVVYRAKQILNYIVQEASDGEYAIKSNKVHFHYTPLSITASRLLLYPLDSSLANHYYTVSADSISLEVLKLWPLLSGKNFNLGKVHIIHPAVKVFDRDTSQDDGKPINVALSDMQEGLIKSLSVFNVRQCIIENGEMAIVKGLQNQNTFSINHVNLYIDSLHPITKADFNSKSIDFAAYIRLYIDRPDVQLADTSVSVYVQNLLLDTKRKMFSVNRFNFYSKNDNGSIDSVNLSNMRISHFNWGRWLREGLIEIDSLKAYDGATYFDLSDRELFSLKNKSDKVVTFKVRLPMLIHALEINKIAYSLRAGSPSGPLTLQLDGDSLAVNEIELTKDSLRPIQFGNLAFKVTGFSNNYDNNFNESTFEKLIIDHNTLELINYKRKLRAKSIGDGSSLSIPSLKVLGFSFDDLLRYRIKADKLILEQPSLVIDIQKSGQKRDADTTVTSIMRSLRESLAIKQLSIRNASIVLIPKSSAATGKVAIENLDTEIDANQLLESRSVMDIISSATALSTSGFRVTGPNIDLNIQRSSLNPTRNGIYLDRVSGKFGEQVELDLQGVSLRDESERFDVTHLQEIPLDMLDVQSGKITLNLDKPGMQNAKTRPPVFIINKVRTGPVDLELLKGNKRLTVDGIRLNGTKVLIKDGAADWGRVALQSGEVHYRDSSARILAGRLDINQPGDINIYDLNFIPAVYNGIDRMILPHVMISASVGNTDAINLNATKVVLNNPSFAITLLEKSSSHQLAKWPDFSVKELSIVNPAILINDGSPGKSWSTFVDSGNILIKDLKGTENEYFLTASSVHFLLNNPLVSLRDKSFIPKAIEADINHFSLDRRSGIMKANIDSALVRKFPLELVNKSTARITDISVGLRDYTYQSNVKVPLDSMIKNADWWGDAALLKYETPQYDIAVFNPYWSARNTTLSFDSLKMIPLLSREKYWAASSVERDYNTLTIGKTFLRHAAISDTGVSRKLHAGLLEMDDINFLTQKDKTRGPDTVSYRPLLARSFQRLPFSFDFDTIHFTNSSVHHNLFTEKSKNAATIFFSDLNGDLYNVKNYNISKGDSLRFNIDASLMGSGDFNVDFVQSYTDSLQSFSMLTKMGRMDLTTLNSFLIPLVDIRIDRGIADTLTLAVDADDRVALGKMAMKYHNLRVSLLIKGEGNYFLSNVYNWLLNLVVRSSDNDKTKTIYQERLRNKGIYNYWGKISINGMLNNMGVKGDKKQRRKARKANM